MVGEGVGGIGDGGRGGPGVLGVQGWLGYRRCWGGGLRDEVFYVPFDRPVAKTLAALFYR